MYYAVSPNLNNPSVLMLGFLEDNESYTYAVHKKHVLEDFNFRVITDTIFANNPDSIFDIIDKEKPDFVFRNNHYIANSLSLQAYGYCKGKGIQELSREFYNDVETVNKRLEDESNGE